MKTNPITIIIPVYGALPQLKDCVASLQQNLSSDNKVLIVDDASPNADEIEADISQAIQGWDNFEFHRNKKNLGFIGNCNNAVLKIDKTGNDVILLNSDTVVTPGSIEEMTSILAENNKIGAVSPRSNNATICTVPLSAMPQKGIDQQKSLRLFEKYHHKFPRYSVAPTAHGFCMLIRRSLIKEYGLFDTVYGKGYGEEVDFCQRIAKHGYLSVISNWSYVFHLEARSFTPEFKAKQLEKNNLIVRERYPEYQQSVRDYVAKALAEEEAIMGKSGMAKLKSLAKKLFKSN